MKAAVLSGAGGNVVLSLLDKQLEPVGDTRAVLKIVIRGGSSDEFHPMLNLMQELLEPAETLNYGPLDDPPPAAGHGAQAHLPLPGSGGSLHPRLHRRRPDQGYGGCPGLACPSSRGTPELLNLPVSPLPASGNLTLGPHTITAGVLQYENLKLLRNCDEARPCEAGSHRDGGSCRSEGH